MLRILAYLGGFLFLIQLFQSAHGQANQPIPALFTNSATSFKFNKNQVHGSACTYKCTRKSATDFTTAEWNLYIQLYIELNRRGWLNQLSTEHNYDCNGRACLFHGTKFFLGWHRHYTSHLEQLLQTIDHSINPNGVAQRGGQFCLGYWDWGYQTTFNNDFTSSAYRYLFNSATLGTLRSGTRAIPDGKFANFQVPAGTTVTRGPSLGSNNWAKSVIAGCIGLRNIEANGDASQGFRPCFEYAVHNAVHNCMGANFASFTSPKDPLFFLHHGGIDYIWWVWEQYKTNVIDSNWDATLPRPYQAWTLRNTLDERNYCYTYAAPKKTSKKSSKMSMRKVLQATNGTLPTNVNALPAQQSYGVKQVLSETYPPTPIPYQDFKFLTKHFHSQAESEAIYQEYLKAIGVGQKLHYALNLYFKGNKANRFGLFSSVTRDHTIADFNPRNRQSQDLVKYYVNLLHGRQ